MFAFILQNQKSKCCSVAVLQSSRAHYIMKLEEYFSETSVIQNNFRIFAS